MTDQVPLLPTVAVPTSAAVIEGDGVASGAGAVRVGVVTLVILSPLVPLSLDADSTGADGADGAAVSMVRPRAAETAETLPATSLCVAVRLCEPAASKLLVIDQVPLVPTTAEPTVVLPSCRVTVSPAIPVPVEVGVVTLVMSSPCTPLSLGADRTGAPGAPGNTLSMVTPSAVEAADTLPATSVWIAVRLFAPAGSVLLVIDQVPLAATVPVPTMLLPS